MHSIFCTSIVFLLIFLLIISIKPFNFTSTRVVHFKGLKTSGYDNTDPIKLAEQAEQDLNSYSAKQGLNNSSDSDTYPQTPVRYHTTNLLQPTNQAPTKPSRLSSSAPLSSTAAKSQVQATTAPFPKTKEEISSAADSLRKLGILRVLVY